MLKKHKSVCVMIFCLALTLVFASCGKKGQEDFAKGMEAFDAKKYALAMKKFESAAEQGHDEAQYYLGLCYAKGFGVKKDMDKAFEWYGKAAEKGNAKAMLDLAVYCYAEGKGVKNDEQKAFELIQKAADKGTLAQANSLKDAKANLEVAKALGAKAAEAAKAAGISVVTVDRGGNKYTGRVAAIVEAMMAGGVAISAKKEEK